MNKVLVSGHLLQAGYQYDGELFLDLYGYKDEDGFCVESVAIAGSKVDIVQLFRPKQLESMGHYLDLIADYNPEVRRWAEQYRHDACRLKD